jgi:coenzyme F420-0:L-glutamate ligase
MQIKAIKTSVFLPGQNLTEFVIKYVPKVEEGTVLVVTSKIVGLAENRLAKLVDKDKVIKQESEKWLKTKWCYLTLKDGQWSANAGVDASNVPGGGLVLLPKNSYRAADSLRKQLRKFYKVKNFGVLITDSQTFPLRAGVMGNALGYAGFAGLRNYIGRPDLFGRKLKMTRTNIADSLAAASVMLMGEGSESCPLALITNINIQFKSKVNPRELRINSKDDIYKPLFSTVK